jgi:hypothetical protein
MKSKLQFGFDPFKDIFAGITLQGVTSVGVAVSDEEEGEDGEESDGLHVI